MKKSILILLLFFVSSCSIQPPQEMKAEYAVTIYLDSLNHQIKNYKILAFKHLHPIYNSIEDDPNYEKLKNTPAKLDSIGRHFKPEIVCWVIYVRYQGKDQFNNLGIHSCQCLIDKKLTKCKVGIPVPDISHWNW